MQDIQRRRMTALNLNFVIPRIIHEQMIWWLEKQSSRLGQRFGVGEKVHARNSTLRPSGWWSRLLCCDLYADICPLVSGSRVYGQ